jgi:glyoxylase-like metal-dependent hydrolase (beta-lactamase superfamily II)
MSKLNKTKKEADIGVCREIAPGVYCLEVGKGIMRSNVYFVRSVTSWVLIDAASANCGQLIRKTAESLFGANTRPASILLTHDHPDHAGSALELARMWDCPVYLHPDELPLAVNGNLSTIKKYANPLDRWLILPLLRLMPRRRVESMLSKASLKDVAQAFDPGAAVPGLPDWECIPTPGHTPGHVAFFRASDRFLITGDAIVTVDLNSFWGFLLWSLRLNKQKVSGPPWYSTWDRRAAKESVAVLAGLEPRVLASGHGMPVTGDVTALELRAFAERFSGLGKVPKKSASRGQGCLI